MGAGSGAEADPQARAETDRELGMSTLLPLAAIRLDDACQPRVITDFNLAGEYAEAMVFGATFPPVVVFDDGDGDGGYWMADGFHRWHAAHVALMAAIA